jgi:hypothetical protein
MPSLVDVSGTMLVDRVREHVTHERPSMGARLLRGEALC